MPIIFHNSILFPSTFCTTGNLLSCILISKPVFLDFDASTLGAQVLDEKAF
jgi:hypothetical protein